jgi:hypothetical protein
LAALTVTGAFSLAIGIFHARVQTDFPVHALTDNCAVLRLSSDGYLCVGIDLQKRVALGTFRYLDPKGLEPHTSSWPNRSLPLKPPSAQNSGCRALGFLPPTTGPIASLPNRASAYCRTCLECKSARHSTPHGQRPETPRPHGTCTTTCSGSENSCEEPPIGRSRSPIRIKRCPTMILSTSATEYSFDQVMAPSSRPGLKKLPSPSAILRKNCAPPPTPAPDRSSLPIEQSHR